MKISKGAMIAIAAAIAIPTTVVVAKSYHHHHGWHHQSPETRARLMDGRIAMAKTALKLTAEQEPLWAALEKEVRAIQSARAERWQKWREKRKARREARKSGDKEAGKKKSDLAERFEKRSERLAARAERAKSFSAAFTPFYASLDDEQKDVMRAIIRKIAPGMRGHRGHKRRWSRWGGDRDKWKHRGWHRDRKADRSDDMVEDTPEAEDGSTE